MVNFTISLTEKELEEIRSMIRSEITRYYDENDTENEWSKRLDKIDQKLIKSVNKKHMYYSYQLNEDKTIKKEFKIK